MNLIEASKFYGSYQALCDETREMLCENVEAMSVPEEILSCSEWSDNL